MNVKKYAFLVSLFLFSSHIEAACFSYAAERFGVDEIILKSIAHVESSFNDHAMNVNNNRSYDIGIMQINSIHKQTLEKAGLTMVDLLDPCTNVIVGAWLLGDAIERSGGDVWEGVGRYHSATPKYAEVYIDKVRKAFKRLNTGGENEK